MWRHLVTVGLLVALAVGTTFIFAQTKDDEQPVRPGRQAELAHAETGGGSPAAQTEADPTGTADSSEAEAEKEDPFTVPEGNDTKVLSLYLRRLVRAAPEERSPEGIRDHLNRLDSSITEVMSRDVDEDLFVTAAEIRLEVLSLLPNVGDESGAAKREKLLESLKEDPRQGIQDLAFRTELSDRVSRIPAFDAEDKEKLIQDLAALAKKTDTDDPEAFQSMLETMMKAAQVLEQTGDYTHAATAYREFSEVLATKDDERLEGLLEHMTGTMRRLELPGNPIDIAGTTLDGEAFDIKQLDGKVVLVDYWATWCPPCVAEIPHLKEMYEAYHEKGFEVVGISLDDDRGTLEEFLEREEIPWINLYPTDEEKQGIDGHPLARRYGIASIPSVFLVDQEGKVVSMQARGRELTNQLEKLLGPIDENEESDSGE